VSRILITPRSLTSSPGAELAPLERAGFELFYSQPGRQPSEAELLTLVPGCDGWLAGVEPISAKVLDAADRLRVISRNGVGMDSIDLAVAERLGIKIMTTPGANAAAVAELTVGLIICGLRHLAESAAKLKAGTWSRAQGREVNGCTIGLVGCGAVGRAVAEAVSALGAKVLAYDLEPSFGFQPSPRFAWAPLDDVLSHADVVSLHCPALPDAAPLLTATRFGAMKRGALLVNTARASLVDELALLDALDQGRIDWYATDVFAVEPPPASRLLSHERVFATPHIGAFTAEGGRRAAEIAVENLLSVLVAPKTRRAIAR
jgi:D-3-phosphoglycerate dehydrogenase / 2-oxoglutarate reductase